jgi:hypothetical protein
VSAALYLVAGFVVSGLDFRQESRKLRFGRIAIDIVEGLAVARANRAILAVILVSIIMNMFAFSYSALIAPIGLDVYGVSPILVGALAAAEPLGAIATGIALSAGWLRLNGSRALLRGSLLFLIGLMAMAASPFYSLAFVLLLIGGFGTAAFSNMQTTLILTEAPFATRSRVMGIVTDRRAIATAWAFRGDPYHGRFGHHRIGFSLEEADRGALGQIGLRLNPPAQPRTS